MTHNPYLPPAAAVADIAAAEISVPGGVKRPARVMVAVILLWATFFVGGAGFVVRAGAGGVTKGMLIVALIFVPIAVTVTVWIIRGVRTGQDWAPVTLAVMAGLRVALGIWNERTIAAWPIPGLLVYLVSFILLGTALALLYTRAARSWYMSGRTSDYRSTKRLTATSGLGQ